MKILRALLVTALLACGAAAQQPAADADAWKKKMFTAAELKKFDGKEGRPVYVAVDGIVYDLTNSKYWKAGKHMQLHNAGLDLSSAIHKKAPKFIHKDGKILEKMPKVGGLIGPETARPAAPAPAPAAEKPAAPPQAAAPAAEPKQEAAAKPAGKASMLGIHKIAQDEIGREAKCPVSGDKLTVSEKTLALDLKGKTYYFTTPAALEKFKASPEKYLGVMDKVKNLFRK